MPMEMIGLAGAEEDELIINQTPKNKMQFCRVFYLDIGLCFLKFYNTGLTGFDSIVLCKCKHVVRWIIST